MLCWIPIFGGLLVMVGQHDRSETLFYYFRLEDQVPAHHLLRRHQHEPARQRARGLANTPEFARAQRQRKKVEALFAKLKNQIGLHRLPCAD